MSKLVSHDQTGFIKNRLASDNIRRLLHIIHATKDILTPCAILSLDAEKAFDQLEWDYLWMVLNHFNLGQNFIHMVKTLYRDPSAVVITGSLTSTQFPISRSCRQGCPLSAILFVLFLEPLAQKIRQHPLIHPITFQNTSHQISLYCDDILLYIDNVSTSLAHLLEIFNEFSSYSGYKINWLKSAFLPLNSNINPTSFPSIIPRVEHFRYLGVEIYPSLNEIISKNYSGILNRVTSDLERWINFPISLQSRVSIIKAEILPRLNFFSAMLPLPPPPRYWENVHSQISKFIWKGN